MSVSSDARLALASGLTMVAIACALMLGNVSGIDVSRGWVWPVVCLVAATGLLAVAERGAGTAYAGALTRLSQRHGLPVWTLRLATVATAPLAGAGVAVYAGIALRQALDASSPFEWDIDWRRCAATGLLGLAFVLACVEVGAVAGSETLLWSVLLAGSGLSLLWWLPPGGSILTGKAEEQDLMLRFHLAVLLTLGAMVYILSIPDLLSAEAGTGDATLRTVGVTVGAMVALALVVGPRWLRTNRALTRQRIELARANERTDLAGQVHDEVMQTLALIQDRADEPVEVRKLARRQERDLRSWLVLERPAAEPSRSIASALRAAAAEVEDWHGVKIDVVTVGDAPIDTNVRALVLAAREALINAAKYASDAPISLFGEVEERRVTAYVRDRGPGFDLDAIPDDRHGVRDSIFGRMVRHGGHATIRTAPGGGCEVQLVQERKR